MIKGVKNRELQQNKKIQISKGLIKLVIKNCKYFNDINVISSYEANRFNKINIIKNWFKKNIIC